jgi:hypothetical protein
MKNERLSFDIVLKKINYSEKFSNKELDTIIKV